MSHHVSASMLSRYHCVLSIPLTSCNVSVPVLPIPLCLSIPLMSCHVSIPIPSVPVRLIYPLTPRLCPCSVHTPDVTPRICPCPIYTPDVTPHICPYPIYTPHVTPRLCLCPYPVHTPDITLWESHHLCLCSPDSALKPFLLLLLNHWSIQHIDSMLTKPVSSPSIM